MSLRVMSLVELL